MFGVRPGDGWTNRKKSGQPGEWLAKACSQHKKTALSLGVGWERAVS